MQIRTATSCLYATATFLNSLPEEHIENIGNELKSMLLANSTYWKLNKHPTPTVSLVHFYLISSYFKSNVTNHLRFDKPGILYCIPYYLNYKDFYKMNVKK